MGPVDDAKAIAEAGGTVLSGTSKLMDSLLKLRPGLAVASEARGIASANRIMLDAIEETRSRCERMGLPQDTTDAMCLRVANEFSKSENLSSCLSFARDVIGDDSDASGIDLSWFIRWADGAEEQVDDEMRVVWGKLLAGELEEPGSYSKRTMSVLGDMSVYDAKIFAELCSMAVFQVRDDSISSIPRIVAKEDESDSTFNGGYFDLGKICQLESLGIIDSTKMMRMTVEPRETATLAARDHKVILKNESAVAIEFRTTPVLTQTGIELSHLCEMGTFENLDEYIEAMAVSVGLTVVR